MAITIKFDPSGVPEKPTLVLATRDGTKLGEINTATDFDVRDTLTGGAEFSVTAHKTFEGRECSLWDSIAPLKLVWCREWDKWFQIDIDTEESSETVKHITAMSLAEAELSQINLYDFECNTESDISSDDYVVTVLYDASNPKGSLLNRMLEKAPHYSIGHVDNTIQNIQRSFSFDNTSIYDAMQEISEEVGCIFIFGSASNLDGTIKRTIDVYDLNSSCLSSDCDYNVRHGERYRAPSFDVCPICGSGNVSPGYGTDTTIFVTSDNLTDDIRKTPDTSSVKNCFKLVGGDELMTAAIISCNPNGSQYIWNITDEMRADMSDELKSALESYDTIYQECVEQRMINLDTEKYNQLVAKYRTYDDSIADIKSPVVGFSNLMLAQYNAVDFESILQTSLMPEAIIKDTTSSEQASLIEAYTPRTVSLASISTGTSQATVENAIRLLVKSIIDITRFSFQISTASWVNAIAQGGTSIWSGVITVQKEIGDGDWDVAATQELSFVINDDYENYVKQLLEKKLSSENNDNLSISGLFAKEQEDFVNDLTMYSLDSLSSIADACQGVLDILVDEGFGSQSSDMYESMYLPYYNKLIAVENEMDVRDEELTIIRSTEEEMVQAGNVVMDELNFEKYMGRDLWLELCLYRREDKYENANYVSDGLTNGELFAHAREFVETASSELESASTVQYSISTTLKNLLVIPEFKPLVDHFAVGNWIRVQIDGEVYRLRLVSYEIDYNDLSTIQVEFSDVRKTHRGNNDLASLMSNLKSISTSYDSYKHQVNSNTKSAKYVSDWVRDGLQVTNTKIANNNDNQSQTWDEHGILLKKYEPVADTYADTQMKLVNRGIYITDDAWETVKTAIGNFNYIDPESGKLKNAYGVNAETVIGQLLLGENLAIRNESGSLTFDKDRLTITVRDNKWANGKAFTIRKQNDDGTYTSLFYVDDDGNLVIKGDGSGLDIGSNNSIKTITDSINANRADIDILYADKANVNDLTVINADIENLKVDKANVNDLETNYAKIGALEAVIADVNTINANKADINFANVNTATITEAWIKDLMVQGHIITQSGTIYYLDAIHINANNIDTGTLTADRILLHGDDGLYYQINVDKLGESRIESMTELERAELKNTIHADVITAHSITSDQLTVNNIQGTGGWINLANGTFEYRNAINGNGISWDGEHLLIQADSIVFSSGNNAEEMVQEATDKAVLAKNIADSKNTVYYQTTAPTGGVYKINDVWFDTSSDNAIYCWNGTRWELHELGTAAIADGTITADKLTALDVIAQRLMAQNIEVTGVTHSADYVRTGTYADSGMGIEFDTKRFSTPNFAIDPSGNIYARGGLIALFNLGRGSNVVYNLGEPDKFINTEGIESPMYDYDAPYLTAYEDGTAIYNIAKTATSGGETFTIGKLWVQVLAGSSESESEDVDLRLAGRVIYLRHDGTTVHESDFSALVYRPDGSLLGNTFALNADYLKQSESIRLEVDLANGDRIKVQRQYGTWQALYYGSNRLMGDPNGAYFGTDGLSIGEDIALTPDGHATVGALTVKNDIGVNGHVTATGSLVAGLNVVIPNDGSVYIRDVNNVARRMLTITSANAATVGHSALPLSVYGSGITINNDTTVDGHVTATGSLVTGQNVVISNDGSVYIRDVNNVARRMLTITSANAATVGHSALPLSVYGSGITLAGATTISGNLSVNGVISTGSTVWADFGIVAGNNYGFYVKNASGSHVKLFWLTSGNVCTVGSNDYATSILGKTITSSKTITVSSDRRLKRDITVLDGRHQALFDRLRPVSYRLREDEDGKEHIGLVAQEVQEALEQSGLTNSALVQADSEGMLSIGYGELIGLLVDEVQTLKAQMQQQETTIEALTRRLDALERGN